MNQDEWRTFLQGWSNDLQTALGKADAENGWLGEEGASEEEIRELEAKLGVPLPPSYRAFLAVSNGFAQPGHLVPRIFGTQQADWLKNIEDNGIRDWIRGEENAGPLAEIADEDYFEYGRTQDTVTMRSKYLWDAVQVSEQEIGGTAVYLLNSAVQFPNGEWEAWLWAHWLPGAQRYRSFADLIVAERESFLEMETGRTNSEPSSQ